MTPERWQRFKELFHAALERAPGERAAFLDEECAGDAHLRAEVESLIQSHEQDGEFMDAPAARMAAGLEAWAGAELEAGQLVGAYRVVGTLGEGGMGKVYLAQDTRLGRKVALKLLPSSFTRDEERVRRFEQEARAASALNHPNILTIYEIGEDEAQRFIATELSRVVTLREHFGRATLELARRWKSGIQIAAALAAAHAAGSFTATSSRRT